MAYNANNQLSRVTMTNGMTVDYEYDYTGARVKKYVTRRIKCFEYIGYLEEMGEGVRRPIGDYLRDKLYELRPKQTRVIYFFMLKDFAVLVHAFRKKTNKVPEKEILLAQKRMNDFVSRYQKGFIKLGGKK